MLGRVQVHQVRDPVSVRDPYDETGGNVSRTEVGEDTVRGEVGSDGD